MNKPKFEIGQPVWHVTPESDQGVVLDVKYSYLTKTHEYIVATGMVVALTYFEHELSPHKIFGNGSK